MGGVGDGVDLRLRACVCSFAPCLSCRSFASWLIRFCPLLAPDFFDVGRRAISSRHHLSTVASFCVAACRLAVISRLRFELVKTAHLSTIASRLAPRPVIPSCLSLAHVPIGRCLPFIAIRLGSSPLPAHRAVSSDASPNRHARRGEERDGGE